MAENIQQELYDRAWELAGRCVERPYNQKPRHRTAVIIAEAILAAKAEEREACVATANAERVLPFYVNPAEAAEPDEAYDMAIDHVTDAIRKRGEG